MREARPITRSVARPLFVLGLIISQINGLQESLKGSIIMTQLLNSKLNFFVHTGLLRISIRLQIISLHNIGVKSNQIIDHLIEQAGGYANHIVADCNSNMHDGDAKCALAYLQAKADMDKSIFFFSTLLIKKSVWPIYFGQILKVVQIMHVLEMQSHLIQHIR